MNVFLVCFVYILISLYVLLFYEDINFLIIDLCIYVYVVYGKFM